MTVKQKLLKYVYPLLRYFSSIGSQKMWKGEGLPSQSFYLLGATLNNGNLYSFEILKGRKVLLVNSASDCGYTPQYEGLQKLADLYPNLQVLVFPSNDFKNQETRDDEEIAEFCKINYGLGVPLFKKSIVRKGKEQSEVFHWLTNSQLNGWNNHEPSWNFNKYLVNGKGSLTHVFTQTTDPLSKEIKEAIEL